MGPGLQHRAAFRKLPQVIAASMLALVALGAVAAPALAPHPPGEQHRDFLFAPPMRPRLRDADNRWRAPFVYPLVLVDRLERRYMEDFDRPVQLVWFSDGRLAGIADDSAGPWLPLGSDSLGRDILSRLLYGARTSLGVALVGAAGALFIGAILGGLAGYAGGTIDELLMRLSEFVLVLPAIYVVLALRAVLPLVLPPPLVFVLLAGILAVVGWPYVARGIRAILAAEAYRDYALAARSLGAGHTRVLCRHLLPAARGFLGVQTTLLLPAFILAEATLSFIGLGFAEPVPSWGSMLREAANVHAIADFPWVLAPAVAIVAVVLAVNILAQGSGEAGPAGLLPPERKIRDWGIGG